jgi:uncharacterized protein (DUF983 family)
MSLCTGIAAQSYFETYGKNSCPQCSEWQLAPTRSEYLNEGYVRHAWSCEACGHKFETAVFFSEAT